MTIHRRQTGPQIIQSCTCTFLWIKDMAVVRIGYIAVAGGENSQLVLAGQ